MNLYTCTVCLSVRGPERACCANLLLLFLYLHRNFLAAVPQSNLIARIRTPENILSHGMQKNHYCMCFLINGFLMILSTPAETPELHNRTRDSAQERTRKINLKSLMTTCITKTNLNPNNNLIGTSYIIMKLSHNTQTQPEQ